MFENSLLPKSLTCTLNKGDQVRFHNGEYYFYTLSFGFIFKKRALFCESELNMRGRDKIIRRCYFC